MLDKNPQFTTLIDEAEETLKHINRGKICRLFRK